MTTANIKLTPANELQLAFVRACLEVEQQHGGQLFIERAPHCNHWSVRVFWPEWRNPEKGGVHQCESFYNLLNYELELKGEYNDVEIRLVKRTLIAAIAKLKDQEKTAKEKRITELRGQLAVLGVSCPEED